MPRRTARPSPLPADDCWSPQLVTPPNPNPSPLSSTLILLESVSSAGSTAIISLTFAWHPCQPHRESRYMSASKGTLQGIVHRRLLSAMPARVPGSLEKHAARERPQAGSTLAQSSSSARMRSPSSLAQATPLLIPTSLRKTVRHRWPCTTTSPELVRRIIRLVHHGSITNHPYQQP